MHGGGVNVDFKGAAEGWQYCKGAISNRGTLHTDTGNEEEEAKGGLGYAGLGRWCWLCVNLVSGLFPLLVMIGMNWPSTGLTFLV